jgi:hypothetical protein
MGEILQNIVTGAHSQGFASGMTNAVPLVQASDDGSITLPQDKVILSGSDETPCISPASLKKLAKSSQASSPAGLESVLDNESYANALDATLPILPPSLSVALSPEKPDKSFAVLVKEADNFRNYRQEGLQYVDPQGDASLIRHLDRVPVELTKALFNFLLHRNEDVKEARPEFDTGRQKPIKNDALINRFIDIIQEHPEITPKIGEEHKWSPQAKKYNRFGFWRRLGSFIKGEQGPPAPLLGRSKLFLSLACGWTSHFMATGKENELESRLMGYKDRSAGLDDALRESYLLNDGNLYLTLLTAENVLSKDLYDKDRADKPLQKKLQYIRNDSAPHGDNFGAWYHYMGAALYGLMRPEAAAKSVMLTEAAGSLFLEGPDRQETLINVLGADFGGKLKNMIKNGTWKQPLPPGADRNFMNLTEFPPRQNREN